MKQSARTVALACSALMVLGSVFLFDVSPAAGQAQPYRAPRTLDGKPDLNGIWQAMGTANWDIEAHEAKPGPVIAMGALGAIPPGNGVVEGGPLPYKPEALKQKKENAENWLTRDPIVKCYLPGVPRATYMPFPFQIIQSPQYFLFAYEYDFGMRTINMSLKEEAPVDTWMGWSRGRWEGETLVIDVTGFNDSTWFDSAGNFHSDALHVVERYTRTGANTLLYEATIEDPNVFTRPWKMSMPLYRRLEKNVELLDFNCVPFVEELMYGHLRKRDSN